MIYTPYHSCAASPIRIQILLLRFWASTATEFTLVYTSIGNADWDFALNDLTWELSSDDVGGYFNQSGDFLGKSYSSSRIGINYGPDGVKGGGRRRDDFQWRREPNACMS